MFKGFQYEQLKTLVHCHLDIELNCNLQHGTAHTTTLHKTDVLVFHAGCHFVQEYGGPLQNAYAKYGSSKHPWGGRHMILLGDPTQLPAVSNWDIFGTNLWRTFSILLLREVKHAKNPQFQALLEKIKLGEHDEEVDSILYSHCEAWRYRQSWAQCYSHHLLKAAECNIFNTLCLEMLKGNSVHYKAIDTDHNGIPLRSSDMKWEEHISDRLPDELHLKVRARVVLHHNVSIECVPVNGTMAQVVSLAQNCIVLCQVDKPKECLPLPHFKQLITNSGASCHIVRCQILVMPGYAVTVHRVHNMTVEQGCGTPLQTIAS